MATTIEILLTSTFDARGFNDAKAAAEEMASKLKGRLLSGEELLNIEGDIFDTGQLERFAEEARGAEQRLRELARAAAEMGDEKLVKALDAQADASARWAKQLQKVGSLTRQELSNLAKTGKSLSERIKILNKASKAEKELAQARILANNPEAAAINLANARAIDQERAALDKLNKELNETNQARAQGAGFGRFDEQFKDVSGIDGFKSKLKELRKEFEGLQKSARGGTQLLDASDALRELDGLEKRVLGAEAQFNQLGKSAKTLGKIVQSSFFQLGFAMFLLQNTLRNFAGIFNGIKQSLIDIGDATNRLNNFQSALSGAGINASVLNEKMREAAGGYVAFATQQQQVVRLINAGLPMVAAQADELITLAKAAELASLGLLKAEQVYPQLVDAIISGDAASLKAIPGLETIATKLEFVMAATKGTSDEMTKLDKAQFIVSELGAAADNLDTQNIEDAAENTRLVAASLGEIKTNMGVAIAAILNYNKQIGETGTLMQRIVVVFTDARKFAAGFAEGILGIGAILATILGPALIEIISLFKQFSIISEGILKIGDLDFTELDQIGGIIEETTEKVAAEAEKTNKILSTLKTDIAESYFGAVEEVKGALGLIPAAVEDIVHDTNESLSDIQLPEGFDLSGPLEQLRFFTSDEFKLLEDVNEAWVDHQEKVTEINEDLTRDIFEIREEAGKDLLELQKEFDEKQIDAAEDLADKLTQIEEDFDLRRGRAIEDAFDKEQKQKEKSTKKLEEIEEKHQRKINEILRRFELSRLKALIDRDARALFEAERRRDEDLRKAEENAEQQKQKEKENSDDRLKQMQEDLDKRLRRLDEDEDLRRQRARQQHEKNMRELQEQLEEDLDARITQREDDIKDAREKATEARKESLKDFKKNQEDLFAHYKKRQAIVAAQTLLEQAAMLEGWDETQEGFDTLYGQFIAGYQDFLDDHSDITQGIIDNIAALEAAGNLSLPSLPGLPGGSVGGVAPPVGGGTGGGGGTGDGCDEHSDAPLRAGGQGAPCSRLGNMVTCSSDGSRWRCVNGQWMRDTIGSGGSGFGTRGTATLDTGGGNAVTSISGTTTPIPVTIQATGDQTLDQIFREISYDAFIEVMT